VHNCKSNKVTKWSLPSQITGNQYKDSCAEVIARLLEPITGSIAGIGLCICFLQVSQGWIVIHCIQILHYLWGVITFNGHWLLSLAIIFVFISTYYLFIICYNLLMSSMDVIICYK